MSGDNEIRRLKRIAIGCLIFLLMYTIGIVGYFSWKVGSVEHMFLAEQPKIIQGLNGKDGLQGEPGVAGPQGESGIQGPQGQKGEPGQSVTPDEIAAAVSQYLVINPPLQGPKGDIGKSGQSGLTPVFKVDTATCQLESQYPGDDGWNILAQLPVPCGVTQ